MGTEWDWGPSPAEIGTQKAYDKLSDGYNSLPKCYQKSDTLQVQICWLGLDSQKGEIHSFPVMHIMGGGRFIGSKWVKTKTNPKKWSKNLEDLD